MKVPAGFVYRGMISEELGLITSVGHSNGPLPVVFNEIRKSSANTLMKISNAHRVEVHNSVTGESSLLSQYYPQVITSYYTSQGEALKHINKAIAEGRIKNKPYVIFRIFGPEEEFVTVEYLRKDTTN